VLSRRLQCHIDTTFTSAVQEFTYNVNANMPAVGTARQHGHRELHCGRWRRQPVRYRALVLTVGNLQPPTAIITSPAAGSPVVRGKALVLSLSGRATIRVRTLGFVTGGRLRCTADSTVFGGVLLRFGFGARHARRAG
jgi:hypothetical protein